LTSVCDERVRAATGGSAFAEFHSPGRQSMGQILRILAIALLVLIGFGTGICGLFGLGVSLTDLGGPGWQHSDTTLIVVVSTVCLLVATGCFFLVRALVREVRAARAKRRAG
jgi:hypothetical protein